jgi:hypothetical protein
VRLSALAALLLPFFLSACQGEEPGGIEALVELAQLEVDPAQPDTNARLTLTVELQARGQAEEVSLVGLTITEQPVSDDSNMLTFAASMVDTETDDSVARLAKGESRVVRVLNEGTTNGDLAAWCRLPVELEVVVETADGEEASATANVMVSCP